MTAIGKVTLRGIVHDDFQYTFSLKSSDAVAADAGVKAVTIDTSAPNQLMLATDASQILGRLEVFEDRTVEGIKVGTVALCGGVKFLVKIGASGPETPAVGDFLVGAGSGYVRKATTVELALGVHAKWKVVETFMDNLSVIAIRV